MTQYRCLQCMAVLCFALLALRPQTTLGDSTDEALSVSVTPIQANLYLLQGRGGNVVASIGDDGILIIDDDYAEYAPAYQQALQGLTDSEGVPRLIINTHWHGDHTGGNGYWGEKGSVILANRQVYTRMSTQQDMTFFDRIVEPSPAIALPTVTYGDAIEIHFNHDTLRVRHYPNGHTDGDSIVFFTGENVVHMGDHYFKDVFPFVDIDSGGNVLGFTANIAAVLELIDDHTVVVPGHGSLATREDLKAYHDMLVTTTQFVKSQLAEGKTLEAIAEAGFGERWQSFGGGFINEASWISFIASSLPKAP
ncbi:MAG: MBL fold metallo-hydrolase [Pseudomonadota bacterium]